MGGERVGREGAALDAISGSRAFGFYPSGPAIGNTT